MSPGRAARIAAYRGDPHRQIQDFGQHTDPQRAHVNVFIFGGSFNPPHIAHVLAVTYVLSTAEPDLVLVVPCYRHPFAKDLCPFEHRLAMCERAMGWLPRTTVSRVEEE